MELRPYQKEAVTSILESWKEYQKTLLVLPTGCGKTIVFSTVAEVRARKNGRVLIMAHREELLQQAADKLQKTCGMATVLEKAENSCIGSSELITVGSVQTLQSEKRLSRFPRDYFSTIIIDEAHHAMSDSYQNVLNYFSDAKVLGVTATPDRGDKKNLGEYFDNLSYEYTLVQAIKQGYLCPIKAMTVPINIDLTSVKKSCGDFQADDAGKAIEPYLDEIADSMAEICMDKKTVVFLPLVSTSQKFRDILNQKGFRACEVNGNSIDRKEVLDDFESGKYNVICNSMLLTEGWDCPSVDCVVVLRPTAVRSLYCQMVGRGTRLSPGKDHLLVLDFLWLTSKLELCRPANLISKNSDIAKKITDIINESDEPIDIEEAEAKADEDAKKQREESLIKQIEENKHKKKKLLDPLEFELSIAELDLSDYEPSFGWEMLPPSEKQLNAIEKFGLDASGIDSKGKASLYLDRLFKRSQLGLATPKQLNTLERKGFKNVADWSMEDASKMIGLIAKNKWKVPYYINPDTYVPKNLSAENKQFDEIWDF